MRSWIVALSLSGVVGCGSAAKTQSADGDVRPKDDAGAARTDATAVDAPPPADSRTNNDVRATIDALIVVDTIVMADASPVLDARAPIETRPVDVPTAADAPPVDAPLDSRPADSAGLADTSRPDALDAGEAGTSLFGCSEGFGKEVFRDDFEGSTLDASRWTVVKQKAGGGTFTQLTTMLASNVRVTGGRLRLSSHRTCEAPVEGAPAHPDRCEGDTSYTGAWVRTTQAYAPGKGQMRFLAKIPAAQPGTFPALWARNSKSTEGYGEFDLIEQWWDGSGKGVASDAKSYSTTTLMGNGPEFKTSSNKVGPVGDVNGGLHVYEVAWDATSATPTVVYGWRDTPGSAKVILKSVDPSSPGLAGNISPDTFKSILAEGWRAYADFAVEPDTTYHVGPESADRYAPDDLEIDSVVICAP